MANHAEMIRNENAYKSVIKRDRNYIEFDLGDGKTRHVATVDKLHYGANNDQEIDTAWTSDTGAWQWKMVANDFSLHARNYINAGDIIQWTDTRSGEYIIIQPLALNWVDNITDSRQQLALPQAVQATIEDNSLMWTNGYGSGISYRYTAHPVRLIKHIIIDNIAVLPNPTVSNPYLEIEFIIKPSDNAILYADGVQWDKKTKVNTADRIEFRLEDGTLIWYFEAPKAEDSDSNSCDGIFQLRRQGGTYYCTVRIPKTWVDSAVFPIMIDPTFTDGYDGDATTYIDTWLDQSNPTTTLSTHQSLYAQLFSSGRILRTLIKFDLSSLSGATVTSATLTLYTELERTDYPTDQKVYSIKSANSGWTESGATWNTIEGSTAWAGSAGCGTSGTDYDATSLGTFAGGSKSAGDARDASLNTTAVQNLIGANYGFLIRRDDETTAYGAASAGASSDNATTARRPKLVIEYTAAAASTRLIDGKLIRGGILIGGSKI